MVVTEHSEYIGVLVRMGGAAERHYFPGKLTTLSCTRKL